MKASLFTSLLMVASMSAHADGLTTSHDGKTLSVSFGTPTFKQVLHYNKMYEKKPFPDAEIYYFSNGVYKLISQGENHYGVYVLQGRSTTRTTRSVSSPCPRKTGATRPPSIS